MPSQNGHSPQKAGAKKNKAPPKPDDSDDDDEEIDEEMAFDSDDERKYGSFFANQKKRAVKTGSNRNDEEDDSSTEGEEEEESDGEDDDGEDETEDDDNDSSGEDDGSHDNGQYMLNLLRNLDAPPKEDEAQQREMTTNQLARHIPEDPFTRLNKDKKKVQLNDLLSDETGVNAELQDQLRGWSKGTATAAPLAQVYTDRAQRKVHYQNTSKDVSTWIPAIQEHRQAETLDFRPPQLERASIVETFVPTTPFEQQMHQALTKAGQSEEASALAHEEAQLLDNNSNLTVEQLQQRRKELAKIRALLFYHEQKRHHINKIKSKTYRRIRKKQKQKREAAEVSQDPALEQELREQDEYHRMKERMTLAHKNTSKWAKRILKRGKNVDVDTRRALSAQLNKGDVLLSKMNGIRDANGDYDSDRSDEDLMQAAQKVLADTERQDEDEKGNGKHKGLLELSFMKRGMERQRERARQEARDLLLELQENEELDQEAAATPSDQVDEDDPSALKLPAKKKTASKAELKTVLADGSMVATSLHFGSSTKGTTEVVSDNPDVAGSTSTTSHYTARTTGEMTGTGENKTRALEQKEVLAHKKKAPPTQSKLTTLSTASTEEVKQSQEENPWLMTSTSDLKKKPKKTPKTVDLDQATQLMNENSSTTKSVEKTKASDEEAASTNANDDPHNKMITRLTQEELVKRAFAGTTEQEALDEFAKEKAEIEDLEDPNNSKAQKKKKKAGEDVGTGWGSWTGKGAPPPKPSKRKLPPRLQAPPPPPKRVRQDAARPKVILSERRVKRMADSCMIAEIPHPYKTREDYERAMAGAIGKEWNVTPSFKSMTRPEILSRAGQVIQPISKRMKESRAPAKF